MHRFTYVFVSTISKSRNIIISSSTTAVIVLLSSYYFSGRFGVEVIPKNSTLSAALDRTYSFGDCTINQQHKYYSIVIGRKAIVHIGAPKTGTTSIQSFLDANRSLLSQQGFHVPSGWGPNHISLTVLTYEEEFWDDLCSGTALRLGLPEGLPSARTWRQARRRLNSELLSIVDSVQSGTFIFSNEHLFERLKSQDQVDEFVDLLQDKGLDLRIVVYIREPLSHAVSAWNTAVKNGIFFDPLSLPAADSMMELHGSMQGQKTAFSSPTWAASSYVSLWEKALPGHVEVRLFDPLRWPEGSLLMDFCAAAGIVWMNDFIQPEPINESVSWSAMKVLNRVNAEIPFLLPDGTIDTSRANQWFIFKILGLKRIKYQPSEQEYASYSKCFAQSNEWVRAKYFPDLRDLWSSRTSIRSPGSDHLFLLELSEEEEKLADFIVRSWPLIRRFWKANLDPMML